MALVVRAKFQALKDFGDHAAVMALVGIADHRSQRGPIARARSLRLLDQVAQGLFANDRENDVAHDPVRLLESGAGKIEQQVLLARDAFQLVEQFPIDPALGARADAINRFDQKIDQIVCQRSSAQMHESREPREPGRLRMAAESRRAPRLRRAADSARVHGEARRRTKREADRSRERVPTWPIHPERRPSSASPDRCATAAATPAPLPGTDRKADRSIRSRRDATAPPAALVSPARDGSGRRRRNVRHEHGSRRGRSGRCDQPRAARSKARDTACPRSATSLSGAAPTAAT